MKWNRMNELEWMNEWSGMNELMNEWIGMNEVEWKNWNEWIGMNEL